MDGHILLAGPGAYQPGQIDDHDVLPFVDSAHLQCAA